MSTSPDVVENRELAQEIMERKLAQRWKRDNREMEKRERLRREILEKFGPVDPALRKEFTRSYE